MESCKCNIRRLTYALLALLLGMSLVIIMTFSVRAMLANHSFAYVSVDGDCGGVTPCYSSIQAAIDGSPTNITIKVSQGVYTNTATQVIYIGQALTITGGYTTNNWLASYPITQTTIIDAEGQNGRRGIHIGGSSNGQITLENLTIQNGNISSSSGAGIYVFSGTVILRHNRIISNTVTVVGSFDGGGGGIYIEDSTVITLEGNMIENNQVLGYGHGGGVFIRKGEINAFSNTFKENYAGSAGGGLMVWDNTVHMTVTNCQFERNNSGQAGGAYVRSGSVIVDNSAFHGNSASYGGAGIIGGGVVTITNSSFVINTASSSGGALVLDNGTAAINSSEFLRASNI